MESQSLHLALDQYHKQGYVAFQNVIDQDLVKEAQEHVEWL